MGFFDAVGKGMKAIAIAGSKQMVKNYYRPPTYLVEQGKFVSGEQLRKSTTFLSRNNIGYQVDNSGCVNFYEDDSGYVEFDDTD
jgi:hypothetical protein